MSYGKELSGIGGWLAFFLVTLGVFTPVASIISVAGLASMVADAPGDTAVWDRVITWEWSMVALMCAVCWFAVARFIFVKNWLTVLIGVGTLWFVAAMGMVIEPMIVSQLTGMSVGDLIGAEGPSSSIIRPLVYATIWTGYLFKSERVENTYRPSIDEDGLAETFE